MPNSDDIELENLRFEQKRTLQHERFQSESGLAAARGVFLLNGAALVAILAFMGDAINANKPIDIEKLTNALWYFVVGIVFAALCHGAGNFWHLFTAKKHEYRALFCQIGTYLFWFASLALALAGACMAADALSPGCSLPWSSTP